MKTAVSAESLPYAWGSGMASPLLHQNFIMSNLHFLADDHAELMVGGSRRHSSGSTTTTTTTNFTFSLGQSNSAFNMVLGSGEIQNGQSNYAVQGIGV
jgi:hypothetical protein